MRGKEDSSGEAAPDFERVSWPHFHRVQIRDNATGGCMCKPLQINAATKPQLLMLT